MQNVVAWTLSNTYDSFMTDTGHHKLKATPLLRQCSSGLLVKRFQSQQFSVDWLSKVSCPTKHIIGHIGDDFYRSYDQTKCQSTEGNQLVFQIRLESHQDHSTMLQ